MVPYSEVGASRTVVGNGLKVRGNNVSSSYCNDQALDSSSPEGFLRVRTMLFTFEAR